MGGQVSVPHGSIHVFRTKLIWRGLCYERIHVRNYAQDAVDIELGIDYESDFFDIFEMRGEHRSG